MTSAEIHARLIDALRIDLVGPALADELLDEMPTRFYLTGFLAPLNASHEQRSDPEANDEPDLLGPGASAEDNGNPDRTAARSSPHPASLGLSLLVSADTPTLSIQLDWGDYRRLEPVSAEATAASETVESSVERWQRDPQHPAPITLKLPASGNCSRQSQPVPADPRLKLAYSVRVIPNRPDRARVVSVFLSNERGDASTVERRDEHFIFQPQITVTSPLPLLPQPNLRGRDDHDEWDERVADLQDREVHSYAVGHGVATEADISAEGDCRTVRTVWIPHAAVDFVASSPIPNVELRMETLAAMPDAAAVETALRPLISGYRDWIQGCACRNRRLAANC